MPAIHVALWATLLASWRFLAIRPDTASADHEWLRAAAMLALVLGLCLTLMATLAALELMLQNGIRRLRRSVPGHCPGCGYDLRESPERCPECGRPR